MEGGGAPDGAGCWDQNDVDVIVKHPTKHLHICCLTCVGCLFGHRVIRAPAARCLNDGLDVFGNLKYAGGATPVSRFSKSFVMNASLCKQVSCIATNVTLLLHFYMCYFASHPHQFRWKVPSNTVQTKGRGQTVYIVSAASFHTVNRNCHFNLAQTVYYTVV